MSLPTATTATVRSRMFDTELLSQLSTLKRFASSITRETDNNDLIQQTLLQAVTAHGSYTPGTSMKSWLFIIMRNIYYTNLRRKKRQVELSEEEWESIPCVSPDVDIQIDLANSLDQIDPERRGLILQCDLMGFTMDELAAHHHCPSGTIKGRLNRSRLQLHALLDAPMSVVSTQRLVA